MSKKEDMRKSDYLLLLPSVIPILFIFVYPLIRGIILTVQSDETGEFTLQNYIEFFTNPSYYETIYKTLILVIPVSLLELFAAFAITYFIRGKMRGKALISALLIFPLLLGALIVDMGVITFFRPSGWFNTLLINIGLIEEPIRLVYNYAGVFISLFILGVAFLASNFIGIMDLVDPNLEKASKSLGASDWTTFRKVFLTLVRNNVLTIFGLNMIMQIGVYTSAVIVGNPANETRTFAVAAFEEASRYFNFGMANTIAVVMAVTQLLILLLIHLLRKKGYTGAATTFK